MLTLSLVGFLSFIVASALYLICLSIMEKSEMDREKASVFECGFDPVKKARLPFSFRFFLVTVIFLVFDVELVLLMPLGLSWESVTYGDTSFMVSIVLFILVYGLFYEWNFGCLNWIY